MLCFNDTYHDHKIISITQLAEYVKYVFRRKRDVKLNPLLLNLQFSVAIFTYLGFI